MHTRRGGLSKCQGIPNDSSRRRLQGNESCPTSALRLGELSVVANLDDGWFENCHPGFQGGRLLENWPGHLVGAKRLKSELIGVPWRIGLAAVGGTILQVRDNVANQTVTDIDQPGEEFVARATEEVLVQKDELLGKYPQYESLAGKPIPMERLVIPHHHKFSNFTVQAWLQGAQQLGLDEINAAFAVETVRQLDSASPGIELALVAGGKDDVVVRGLELNPATARLTAIIPFPNGKHFRGCFEGGEPTPHVVAYRVGGTTPYVVAYRGTTPYVVAYSRATVSRQDPVLDLTEAAEIIAGG